VTGLRVADACQTDDDADLSDGDFLLQCACGLEQRLDTTRSPNFFTALRNL
jgi:hypothetical protein